MISNVSLEPIGDDRTFRELEGVCLRMPCFFEMLNGTQPSPAEALSIMLSLPHGVPPERKEVLLIREAGNPVGCIDLIMSFPHATSILVGMFAIIDERCGSGIGLAAMNQLRLMINSRGGYKSFVAYVPNRLATAGFWRRCGFVEAGASEPYVYGGVKSERLRFCKAVE